MNMNKHIIKKELLVELKNSSSLFLITPTMTVLIIIFPILIENRFAVDEDLFIVSHLLFLIIFSTLFAIRKPIILERLIRELNFGNYKKIEFFNSKVVSEFIIFLPQIIILNILYSAFTNSSVNVSIFYFLFSIIFFAINASMINIIFQIFTSFNNRFVQFILITPMYLALSFFIGPLWLGLGQDIANIYILMYLGITVLIFAVTNFYLERAN
uniref:MedDCM-OCT-S40-C26-cds14 n=1 Tax=Candidatus Actinomarina minuta TaxID=1389454 RepID=S5DXD8_9ACTN|nr:MedDCM-OCT-S40-C26-cds14 [Candidatus Actinomarina minuta]